MGGSGSGRWRNVATRPVAEQSLAWHIGDLREAIAGVLAARPEAVRVEASGEIIWRSGIGRLRGEVAYTVVRSSGALGVVVRYRVGEMPITDPIALLSTPCGAGVRWWWQCPACYRRVGVLYNPYRSWRCRHCYHITYSSSNDSHRYDALFRTLGFEPEAARLLGRR